jgi:rare lipoprotein A
MGSLIMVVGDSFLRRVAPPGLGAWLVAASVLALVGCSSTPSAPAKADKPAVATKPARATPQPGADGPPELPGPDPASIADATPKVEPIRQGGPNKPYEVLGEAYVPLTKDEPLAERGLASWYGRKFHGRRTASGEVYNMHAMTAAHKTMPIPSYALVRHVASGREIVVRINDRGPFVAGRIIDLSYAAAGKLGVLGGVSPVEVRRLTHDDIRALGEGGAPVQASAPPVPPAVVARAVATPVPVVMPQATELPGKSPTTDRAYTTAAVGFWLQLGAFGRADGAYSFQQKVSAGLDWLSPLLTVFADGRLHRLQAGPYPSREAAQEAAAQVRAALQLVPLVVERR